MLFHKILIVGAGVMGGSYLKALLKLKQTFDVTVVDVCPQTRQVVKEVLKVPCQSPDDALKGPFDLILLATSERVASMFLATMSVDLLVKDGVIMDICSVKSPLKRLVKKCHLTADYIGTHPLFGSEKHGIDHASEELVKGSILVVNEEGRHHASYVAWEALMSGLGHQVVHLSTEVHDALYGTMSHTSHVLAFVQMACLQQFSERLMPPSFKTISRIAQSDRDQWAEIIYQNKTNVLQDLRAIIRHLNDVSTLLSRGHVVELAAWLKRLQTSQNLNDLRQDIDHIDDEVIQLLERRMAMSERIGREKSLNKQSFYDPEREEAIKRRITQMVDDRVKHQAIQSVYHHIFETSKGIQGGIYG